MSVETSLGRSLVFQFDRGDSFLLNFVERISEARKDLFFLSLLNESSAVNNQGFLGGEAIYDAHMELQRQQYQMNLSFQQKYGLFENFAYDLCSTYPSLIILPKEFSMNRKKLESVARFRSRARIPAITWFNRKNQAILSRSSQPLTGLKQSICIEDEELLQLLSGGKRMFVIDARGPAAVAGNQLVRGKGAELPSRYRDLIFLFMGIGNIHTMRASQEKLNAACNGIDGSYTERFYQKVEQSNWLAHIRLILDSSCRCAELLELEQTSVLVHCSDGWDRTAQLVSLAQIILDPYFRTVQGLAALIEKDWVGFGFKFRDRCFGTDPDERSPVWIQFVDCIYQFQRQFPKHFEFNERFLLLLAEAPYCGRFATFGFNTENERTEACKKYKARAWEFWTELFNRTEFLNSNFEPYIYGPLWPYTSSKRLILWESLYLKGDASYAS